MKDRTLLQVFTRIKAVRVLAGCLAGMLIAFLMLVAVELFSAIVHPFPPDFSGTEDEICQHVARYSHWVLALVVPAWGLTALASTWTAARIGGRGAALLIGLMLLAGLVFNVSMLPYPMWFKILGVIVSGAAILAVSRLRLCRPAAM
jgi:hypothetical protein